MKTVSFQGTQLSASERRRLAMQQQAKPFLNTHLAQQVEQTLEAVEKLREEGTQGENPNRFRHDTTSRGTPFLGDVFGY